jgi:hypothetical protein
MANSDFFNCVICVSLVEVENSNQDVTVVFDVKTNGWRIICEKCRVRCQEVMHPYMVINYGMLKEKPRESQRTN